MALPWRQPKADNQFTTDMWLPRRRFSAWLIGILFWCGMVFGALFTGTLLLVGYDDWCINFWYFTFGMVWRCHWLVSHFSQICRLDLLSQILTLTWLGSFDKRLFYHFVQEEFSLTYGYGITMGTGGHGVDLEEERVLSMKKDWFANTYVRGWCLHH